MDAVLYSALKVEVLRLRPKMIGLSSKTHWLALPADLLEAISPSLSQGYYDEVGRVTGFGAEAVRAWELQRQEMESLKKELDTFKVSRVGGFTSSSWVIRPKICAVAREVQRSTVCRYFGISRTTIDSWMSRNFNSEAASRAVAAESKVESEKLDEKTSSPVEQISPPDLTGNKIMNAALARRKPGVRRVYTLSEKKVILELVDAHGSKAVHDHYKVSYDTIARLKRRREDGLDRKQRTPLRFVPVMDLMRRHPGMGPMQIRDYLHRHQGLSMGVNSIRKVMEDHGWIPPYTRKARVKDGMQLYEACRRNYLWHMDFKHQYINKCKSYILFVQDDYSRFIVNHRLADGEKIDDVIAAVEDAIRLHGRPEAIMSDGGSSFHAWRGQSQFTRFLEDHGIEQIIASTPNVNGKLENLNQQVEKELILTQSFASLTHFSSEIAQWVGFYNFRRPHQGLGGHHVPADRYFPGVVQWYAETSERTRQQSLIAETMATLLNELRPSTSAVKA